GGLAGVGVAQVRRDNAVLALELLHGVEGVGCEARGRGVQSATGDDHQREAGADLLVVDADVAFVIKRHVVSPCQGCERRPISEALEYHLCRCIVYCAGPPEFSRLALEKTGKRLGTPIRLALAAGISRAR